jgi:hypothetical protein
VNIHKYLPQVDKKKYVAIEELSYLEKYGKM